MAAMLDILIYHVSRLGRIGAIGAALIAAFLVADALVLSPLAAEYAELAERNRLAAVVQPAPGHKERSEAAAAVLPHEDSAEAFLRRMFAAAKGAGLSLDQGDYQLSRGKQNDLFRYQLTLPVYGSYPAVRDFIRSMLNENPALAVTSIDLRRDKIGETELGAELHFTLYLKEGR